MWFTKHGNSVISVHTVRVCDTNMSIWSEGTNDKKNKNNTKGI